MPSVLWSANFTLNLHSLNYQRKLSQQCAVMLSKDTGSRQTDGGDACVTCHVYQSGTRTMEYILCSGPWPCSATTSATHFLRVSVILRSGCWVLRKWMNNIFMGWQHRKTKTWALMLWGRYQGGKPHSIEFCFPVNWISQKTSSVLFVK